MKGSKLRSSSAGLPALAGLLVLLSACAPQRAPSAVQGVGDSAGQPSAPKTITMAVQREPAEGFITFSGGAKRGGGHNARFVVHNSLIFTDEQLVNHPQLAAELISVDHGTWRINADGTMDTTWKLHPNVKWHDGRPFTSDDLLFGYTVKKDRDVPWRSTGRPELMQRASTPDALTFEIRWSAPYFRANEAPDLEALPRHLLEDVYRDDKPNFVNSPRFTTEFIGLGPYKLERWQPGSHMEFSRFDDYFRGRPPFDSVVLRFLGDPNTMVANALAGNVDLLLPIGIDVDAALEIQRRWEGTGHRVRFVPTDFLWQVEIQHRPEYARPTYGLTDRTVRQAFYHAIDRATLAEVATNGLAPVADSWFAPGDAVRRDLESSIPQFPYDLARAQGLLAQAGWNRGSDGVLVHAQTGERFEIELRGNQAGGIEKQLNVVADGWKALGARANLYVVPTALEVDAEHAGTLPGGVVKFQGSAPFIENRMHTQHIAAPANRWSGRNRAGYSSPRVDSLLDRLVVTIDPGERLILHRELLEAQMGDVALMPLWWEVSPVPMVRGLEGPIGGQVDVISDFFRWRRD